MDDNNLAQRAAQGDREAFGELIRLHQTGVYNVAYRITCNHQEAEDVSQEAFLRAFRSIRTLDPARPPGPWLRKIAVNVCLDRLKKRQELSLDQANAASADPGPEPQTIERESNLKVRAALASLPPRYRVAIELRHFQDLSYTEMAETLDRPLSDVKSDLFRARKLLASRLKTLP